MISVDYPYNDTPILPENGQYKSVYRQCATNFMKEGIITTYVAPVIKCLHIVPSSNVLAIFYHTNQRKICPLEDRWGFMFIGIVVPTNEHPVSVYYDATW